MGQFTPGKQNRQPTQAPRVAWANPITRGLIAACLPHLRVEAVNNGKLSQVGNFAALAGPAGVALQTNGVDNNIYFPLPQITLAAWTIFALVKSSTAGLDARAVNFGLSTNDDRYIQVGVENGGNTRVRVLAQGNGGTLPANQPSVGVAFDGATHFVVLTYDGSNVRCYIDGVLDTTAPTSTGALWTINQFSVGAMQRSGGAAFYSGSTYLAGGHSRALSGGEVKILTSNPWQLFNQPQRRLLFDVPAGGTNSYSYTATGGYVMSGAIATVRGRVKVTSGGIQTGGAASVARGAQRSASGGMMFAGTITRAVGKAVTAAGGLVFGGAATSVRAVARSAAGGIVFAGQAGLTFFSAVQSRVVNPVGGIVIAGSALVARGVRKAAAGGLTFAGRAATTFFPPGVVALLNGMLPEFVRRRRRK